MSLQPVYKTRVDEFPLGPEYGIVKFANWLHPREQAKVITLEQISRLEAVIPKGGFCIDIGAHTGDTTIPMAYAVGAKGYVLTYEPNYNVFQVLSQNTRLQEDNPNCATIGIINAAVMPKDGVYEFKYSDPGLCNGGFGENLSHGLLDGHGESLKVKGIRLDETYPKKIDYIKLDTEGMDLEIIKSHSQLIKEHKPVINCEVYITLTKAERFDLLNTIKNLGYLVYFENNIGAWEVEFRDIRDQFTDLPNLMCLPC